MSGWISLETTARTIERNSSRPQIPVVHDEFLEKLDQLFLLHVLRGAVQLEHSAAGDDAFFNLRICLHVDSVSQSLFVSKFGRVYSP
jgi:hypothetical protein